MTDRGLRGVRVVVLRVGGDVDALAAEFTDRGAIATTVRVATVDDRPDDEVRAAVGRLERFAWIAVTSANAARRLPMLWASRPHQVRIGSVGPATTRALADVGVRADVEAPDGTAADLALAIDEGPVLFLASSRARPDLVEGLAARGVDVVVVTAYDVVPRTLGGVELDLVAAADVVVATSPSAVDALVAASGPGSKQALVAIGPTTGAYAREVGLAVAAVAPSREPDAVAGTVASVVP